MRIGWLLKKNTHTSCTYFNAAQGYGVHDPSPFPHQLSDEKGAVQREGLVLAPLAAHVEAAPGVERLEEGPEAGQGAAEVLGRFQAERGNLRFGWLVRFGGCSRLGLLRGRRSSWLAIVI